MRKFTMRILVGVLLMISGTVLADEIQSYIGKQIEGQFPVVIEGERIDQPGLVIEGVSYLPVRAAGELFGYEVSFVDSEVVLNKSISDDLNVESNATELESEEGANEVTSHEIEYTEETLLQIIDSLKAQIKSREVMKELILNKENPSKESLENTIRSLSELQQDLAEKEEMLRQLQQNN